MKTKPLTDATTAAILDAALRLIVEGGQADPALSDIAQAAGVSRQSVYLGFGGRAGLLTTLLDRAAAKSAAVARLGKLAAQPALHPRMLHEVLEAWLDHMAEVYPVAVLLDAAALADPEAAGAARRFAVWGQGFLVPHLAMPGAEWSLRDLKPEAATELVWSLVDARAWRGLVVEAGWPVARFRQNRWQLVRRQVLQRGG